MCGLLVFSGFLVHLARKQRLTLCPMPVDWASFTGQQKDHAAQSAVTNQSDDRSLLAQAVGWASLATTVAAEMVVPILIGAWVDTRLGLKGLFAILGGVMGVTAGHSGPCCGCRAVTQWPPADDGPPRESPRATPMSMHRWISTLPSRSPARPTGHAGGPDAADLRLRHFGNSGARAARLASLRRRWRRGVCLASAAAALLMSHWLGSLANAMTGMLLPMMGADRAALVAGCDRPVCAARDWSKQASSTILWGSICWHWQWSCRCRCLAASNPIGVATRPREEKGLEAKWLIRLN